MGILDKVPFFKKKNDDFMGDFGNDPMKPSTDPLAGGGDPLAQQDPLAGGNPAIEPMSSKSTDPFASGFDDPMGAPSQTTGQYPSSPGYPGGPQQGSQGFSGQQPQQSAPSPQYDDQAPSRDVELILAKLDAIKAELDSVHQRVRKLEGIADRNTSSHSTTQNQQRYSW